MLKEKNNYLPQSINRLIVIISVLIFAVNLFVRFQIISFHSVETGGVEINVIDGIVKILSGKFLYDNPEQPPFDIMQYSPLYYYLVAALAKLLNISQTDPQGIFVLTRSVAFVFNLLNVFIVYLIARKLLLSRSHSIFAGTFSFIILTQHYYSRGDSLYCFLFFLSFYYFLQYLQSGKGYALILHAIISFLAIMTKQSGIIIPASVFLFFIIQKKSNPVLKMIIVYVLLTAMFILISGFIGGMQAIYENVVLGVKNGLSLDLYRSFINDRYFIESVAWIFIGIGLFSLLLKKMNDEKFFFLLFLMLMSLLFACVTGFKNGSSLNYFVEFFILTFLASLIYIQSFNRKLFQFGMMLFFIFTITIKTGELYSAVYVSKYRHDDLENYILEKKVSDFMLNEEKIKSTDLVFLNFRGYTELFLSGNTILKQKDIGFFVNLYSQKDISYANLLKEADHGLIKYLVGDCELSALDILGRHFMNFRLVKSFGKYSVYKYCGS